MQLAAAFKLGEAQSFKIVRRITGRGWAASVPVPVVKIGVVRVRMKHGFVPMRVGMRFTSRISRTVVMAVMLVVRVSVCVFDGLVGMHMLMPLGQVEPKSPTHQTSAKDEAKASRFPQDDD